MNRIINPGFNGNPRLKPEGLKLPFTEHQAMEYARCQIDPIYFIKNYVKIMTADYGVQPFNLYPKQEEMISCFHDNRKSIIKACRQIGKSTTSAAYLLWYVLFNDEKLVGMLANKAATAREILSRVQTAYMALPLWLQQGVREWNKGSIWLENDSRIIATATSSDAIRGFTCNLIYLDEFAFIGTTLAEQFFTSVYPTISSGLTTKMIITSTPNGFNHFYRLWDEASKGINGFVPFGFAWNEVPNRDEKWLEDQRRTLGEFKFRQEIQAEFLGSSLTLVSPDAIGKMSADIPIYQEESGLTVYYPPEADHKYVLTADVSHGQFLDYSTFIITDITAKPFVPVAVFRSNSMTPLLFPYVIQRNAMAYNNAYVLVEINDLGQQVADELYIELEYPNMLFSHEATRNSLKPESVNDSGNPNKSVIYHPGLRTTKRTKRLGCENFKILVESNQFRVNDYNLISELSTFTARPNKTYEADEGHYDDMVMCGVLFGWLTTQVYFKDLTNNDVYKNLRTMSDQYLESMMLPVGFYLSNDEHMKEIHDGAVWDKQPARPDDWLSNF